MKKVILINQSSNYLMVDIANAFEKHYDEVILMSGRIEFLDVGLNENIKFSKLIKYNRNSNLYRALTWILATIQILFRLLFIYRQHEIVYVTNPPMSYLISLFIHRPFSIIVFDIYPDVLKNFGMDERNFIYKLWAKWNVKLFDASRKVFTLSEGMKKLLSKYVVDAKIMVIPNWSHSNKLRPVPKSENPFVKHHNLDDKFIVLYSGNIGYTHSVEVIIDVAKSLSSVQDIEFLIIGEGGKKKILKQMVSEYGLSNCTFLTWQSSDVLPYSLASADLAVITLNDETAKLSVPSKTYHLMAVGAPLLCIAPYESELNNLVSKYKNGVCFESRQISEISNYILDLKNDPSKRKSLSENSIQASTNFTVSNASLYAKALYEND